MGDEVEARAECVCDHLHRPDHPDWKLTDAKVRSTGNQTVPDQRKPAETTAASEFRGAKKTPVSLGGATNCGVGVGWTSSSAMGDPPPVGVVVGGVLVSGAGVRSHVGPGLGLVGVFTACELV